MVKSIKPPVFDTFSVECEFDPGTLIAYFEISLNYCPHRSMIFVTEVKLGEQSKPLSDFLEHFAMVVSREVFTAVVGLMTEYLTSLLEETKDIIKGNEETKANNLKEACDKFAEGKLPLHEFFDKILG